MRYFRLAGISAGTAFVVSLLLGLVTGAPLPALLLRPALFAVLFALIAFGAQSLFETVLRPPPDFAPLSDLPISENEEDSGVRLGQNIDVSVGEEEGLDVNCLDNYTGQETFEAAPPASAEPEPYAFSAFTPLAGEVDLAGGEETSGVVESTVRVKDSRLAGFGGSGASNKQMASAIRTVLSREDEG